MQWFFLFFVISGFCSLVYQIAWLRMSMAGFGATATSISLFLSIFMAGMALGSWGGGRLAKRFSSSAVIPLRLYAAAEACIALSGLVVAPALDFGHKLSIRWGGTGFSGYIAAALLLSLALLPFCACMGATFPLAIASAKRYFTGKYASSFSFLYVANLLGAMIGALASAFVMIEVLGFKGTILLAAVMNMLVAVGAFLLAARGGYSYHADAPSESAFVAAGQEGKRFALYLILFLTGFVSLAMEVVWTRLYMPVFGPVVYTFAVIIAAYLLATVIGSQHYRYCRKRGYELTDVSLGGLLATVAATALFPLLVTDPRLPSAGGALSGLLLIMAGIGPFCGLLGFITPAILDRLSSGDPEKIGNGYALNMLGCIVGPLAAGFLLLPFMGERWALAALAAPLLLSGILFNRAAGDASRVNAYIRPVALVVLIVIMLLTKDPESLLIKGVVKRDHTATVIAAGEGMNKVLLVNGYGMTSLTPITKMMVHLPMAFHGGTVAKGVVLCFGMGTSYRSMLTWGVAATVVELVPSVPGLIPFYHADGAAVLSAPNGRIVIDDARRFLERSEEYFDIMVVDPPPPVEAAASSLLYSKEFYEVVKRRLAPGGIFQQWVPTASGGGTDDAFVISSMMKAIAQSFPYVRTFFSSGEFGIHILASMQPIPDSSPEELASRLSPKALADLMEWGPKNFAADQFREVLLQEEPVEKFIAANPAAPELTDDRPVNEYYMLRRLLFRAN